MELLRTIWFFFQDQILGMKWLNALIGRGLEALGLDPATQLVIQDEIPEDYDSFSYTTRSKYSCCCRC